MGIPSFIVWFPVGLAIAFVTVVLIAMVRMVLKANDSSAQRVLQSAPKKEAAASSKGEKRRADRVPCNWSLELLPGADLMTSARARLLNLSSTGACFASTVSLTPGAFIRGRLMTADNGLVQFSGLVIWRKITGGMMLHGVRFNR